MTQESSIRIKDRDITRFIILDLEGTLEITELSAVITDAQFTVIDKIQIFCENKIIDREIFEKYVSRKYGRFNLDKLFLETCVPFQEALKKFDVFLKKNLSDHKFMFMTCGFWDLNKQIPKQCLKMGIEKPQYFNWFVNIKKVFESVFKIESEGMDHMLYYLNIQLDGNHHCAIDDCLNLAKLMKEIHKKIINDELYPNNHYRVCKSRF